MRVFVSLLLGIIVVVTPASAQSGVTVEGSAGLSFPTDSDFKEGFETGLVLGARGAYGITDQLKATLSILYNRFSSKDVFVESNAAKAAGIEGFNAQITNNLLGIRAGVQYGDAVTETIGYFVGVEGGPTSQKSKSDLFESEAVWDATVSVYAGGRYYFTPTASVGFGPAFSLILAESSYHFLDFVVNVAFEL